eukprot:tig00000632_g2740.t1
MPKHLGRPQQTARGARAGAARGPRALSSPSVPPPPADEIHSIGPLLDDKPHPPPDAAVALPPSPSAPAVPRRRSSFARIRGLDKIDHKDEALSDGEPDEDSKLREILKLRLTVSHTDPKTGRRRSLSAPSTPRTDEENAGHPPPPLATLQPEEKPQTASARGPTPSQQHRQRPLSAADMFRMREAAAGGERAAGGGIAGMTQGEGGSNAAPSARRASVRTVAANGDRYSLSMEAADGLIKVGFRTGQPPAHLICQKRANSFRGQSPRSPETGTVPQVSPAARASFSGPSPLPAGDAFALPDPSSTRSQRTLSLDSATAASIPHPDDPPPAVLPATQSLPANAI